MRSWRRKRWTIWKSLWLKIRPDRLDVFKAESAEILCADAPTGQPHASLRLVPQRGRHRVRGPRVFPNEHGLIEHKLNTMEPTAALFRDCVVDHHATLFGIVSEDLSAS